MRIKEKKDAQCIQPNTPEPSMSQICKSTAFIQSQLLLCVFVYIHLFYVRPHYIGVFIYQTVCGIRAYSYTLRTTVLE